MKKDNILEFPKSKIVREVPGIDDEALAKAKEKTRKSYADELTAEIADGLYQELDAMGIETNTANFTKDFIYISDVLKALVYRSFGIEHPAHKVIDERVKVRSLPVGATPEEVQAMIDSIVDEVKNKEGFDIDNEAITELTGVINDLMKDMEKD